MSDKTVTAAVAGTALAGALTLSLATAAPAQAADQEKCYGIAKAGQNDCQTSNTSCAGTSKTDGQWDAWVYVPEGMCDRIVGGTAKPDKDVHAEPAQKG